MITRVQDASRDYDEQFDQLMRLLRAQGQGQRAGDIVRYLTFRLDFNDYHHDLLLYKLADAAPAQAGQGQTTAVDTAGMAATVAAKVSPRQGGGQQGGGFRAGAPSSTSATGRGGQGSSTTTAPIDTSMISSLSSGPLSATSAQGFQGTTTERWKSNGRV